MTTLTVKISFEEILRRLTLPTAELSNFKTLCENIRILFPLLAESDFSLLYTDLDGDLITVSTSAELKEALTQTDKSTLKFVVKPSSPLPKEKLPSDFSIEEKIDTLVSFIGPQAQHPVVQMLATIAKNALVKEDPKQTQILLNLMATRCERFKKLENLPLPSPNDPLPPPRDLSGEAGKIPDAKSCKKPVEEEKPKKKKIDVRELRARFMTDISIPDGAEVTCASKFTKTWELNNDGHIPWPADTLLTYSGGDRLSEQTSFEIGRVVAAGESIEVSIDLVAPACPGRYMSYWRLAVDDVRFGHRIWCDIRAVKAKKEADKKAEVVTGKDYLAAAASTVVKSDAALKWKEQLAQLAEFGWKDSKLNVTLLEKHGGDILPVIDALLKLK